MLNLNNHLAVPSGFRTLPASNVPPREFGSQGGNMLYLYKKLLSNNIYIYCIYTAQFRIISYFSGLPVAVPIHLDTIHPPLRPSSQPAQDHFSMLQRVEGFPGRYNVRLGVLLNTRVSRHLSLQKTQKKVAVLKTWIRTDGVWKKCQTAWRPCYFSKLHTQWTGWFLQTTGTVQQETVRSEKNPTKWSFQPIFVVLPSTWNFDYSNIWIHLVTSKFNTSTGRSGQILWLFTACSSTWFASDRKASPNWRLLGTMPASQWSNWHSAMKHGIYIYMYIYIYIYTYILYGAASAGPPPPPMVVVVKDSPPVVWGWFVVLW